MAGEWRVEIEELRGDLDAYIGRVKDGETFEVTEDGLPIAALRPLSGSTSTLDRLVTEGKAWSARGRVSDLPPPIQVDDPDISRKIREALDDVRADTI